MQALPHRFREEQFRTYEPFIHRICTDAATSWPCCIKCDPKLFRTAQTTFVARLRDAIISYRQYNWPSTINRAIFDHINPELSVSERVDGSILLGHRTAIKNWSSNDRIALQPETTFSGTINLSNINAVNLLMTLSHNRLLSPRIRVAGLNDVEADTAQRSYDIALDKNPDGSYTLI